jgi:hypothetical protein
MDDKLKDIRIGKGIGTLMFGSTREQVKQILGEPSEVEKYSLSEVDSDNTEAWHYDEHDLSLSFDEENDFRLSSIAISGEGYTLEGQPLIGRKKPEVFEQFKANKWGEPEEDEEVRKESGDCCLYHIDDSSMSLWFENDELTEVQIGPFYKNEEIVWPHEQMNAR